MSSTRRWPEWGTSSEGLKITVFPQSNAGNIFQVGIAMGKLKGGDEPGDPDGAAVAHRPLVAQLRRDGVAEEPAALHRRVIRGIDSFLHVAPGLGQYLAHLARHGARNLFLAR